MNDLSAAPLITTPDFGLRLASYNIHKGVLGFRASRLTIHGVREQLHQLDADLIFLQEVQGKHEGFAKSFKDWPAEPQHEFLARRSSEGPYHVAYGLNALYAKGHHGNALLSKFPIRWWDNRDVSHHRLERRGILHCLLDTPIGEVHALVIHFGLFAVSRRRQTEQLLHHVASSIPAGAPLLIAGDFNDWRGRLSQTIEKELNVQEVFLATQQGKRGGVLSFPAHRPMVPLDRIYQRGFEVTQAQVFSGREWSRLSDHAPIMVDLAYGKT
ncbi:MAG: endonuclease/exonuclease/phosphatase family protein [Burkholderiaceae bacterium]